MIRTFQRAPAVPRLKALLQFGLLCTGAWFSMATSDIESCYYGTNLFDGQTNVPVDTVIRFESTGVFPRDLPAITSEAASLVMLPERIEVEVEYRIDAGSGQLTLVPKAPLQAGREYEAFGVDLDKLETTNHMVSSYLTPVRFRFRTSPSPKAIALFQHPDYEQTSSVLVVFSEAVDPASIDDASVRFSREGGAVSSRWVGNYGGRGNVLQFAIEAGPSEESPTPDASTATPAPSFVVDAVEVTTAVRGLTGMALDGDGDGTGGELEDWQTLYLEDPSSGGGATRQLPHFLGDDWCGY